MPKRNRLRSLSARLAKRLRPRPGSTPSSTPDSTVVATPDTPPTPEPTPEPTAEPTAETGTRLLSAVAIQKAISATPGPVLINHWATWCEGCVEELPLLVELHQRFGTAVTFVGISWETFQFERQDPVAHVQAFAQEHGVVWDSLLVQDRPDRLFEALEMRCQTVPQIWVLGADGQVLYRCEQVLDAAECERLATVLKQVSS